jgi:hypothetical protein
VTTRRGGQTPSARIYRSLPNRHAQLIARRTQRAKAARIDFRNASSRASTSGSRDRDVSRKLRLGDARVARQNFGEPQDNMPPVISMHRRDFCVAHHDKHEEKSPRAQVALKQAKHESKGSCLEPLGKTAYKQGERLSRNTDPSGASAQRFIRACDSPAFI